ncbi:MAG: GIY-YIG nuclease family protein [Bacteroidota bacterium]
MAKVCHTYITTNKNHTVLYVGMTCDLKGRMLKHKQKYYKGFSARYNVDHLVWYERFDGPLAAIKREKQIKAGSRKQKLELINAFNPEWKDLAVELLGEG